MSLLPIEKIKKEFCQLLEQNQTVVLSAEPGAGKSTCLPLWLLELSAFNGKKIYLLQPRRLAVKNIATFLAQQIGEQVGDTIGYRLRNDSKVSQNTRLEVVTEGILTQIIQQDAELTDTALVIFDEFHERSLQGDLAFALAREVQQALREDLKIVLMSATLDGQQLLESLPDAVSIASEGRSFEVEVSYQPVAMHQHYRDHVVNVITQQISQHQGSILVFLPGVADIRFVVQQLTDHLANDVLLSPLYGELTLAAQQQAIFPCAPHQRKLVLATNIAETSLTIEGITLVIDCGLEKVAVYDSASLMNKLQQRSIAKASAVQRAGRAGRLMPGKCIRLFAKDDFERRPQSRVHDILQADLLPTLIEAARWGVAGLNDLPMLELPSPLKEQQAWQELVTLGVVDKHNKLTAHGELVAQLPCHPRFAHMILSAADLANASLEHRVSLACLMSALLEERDIFKGIQAQNNSDLSDRLSAISASKNQHSPAFSRIVKQAKVLARAVGVSFKETSLPLELTGVLLALAYPERLAKARGTYGNFLCANGKGVTLSEEDKLAGEPYIVVADLMQINGTSKVRLASAMSLADIETVFESSIVTIDIVTFDDKSAKIIARRQSQLHALVLVEQPSKQIASSEDIAMMWCDMLVKKGLSFLAWTKQDEALKARWRWLAKQQNEASKKQCEIVDIDDNYLLDHLAHWFAPFVGEVKSKAQLDKLDLSTMLLSLLDYSQQALLKEAAPTTYIGPTGRHCQIRYSNDKSPMVSLPMQELYGLAVTPSVGLVKQVSVVKNTHGVALLLELLSPAQRPIQVTQDLVSFWSGSYQLVQKDMKSRYPKHYWPDDPANAQATNKTKRHIKNL